MAHCYSAKSNYIDHPVILVNLDDQDPNDEEMEFTTSAAVDIHHQQQQPQQPSSTQVNN